MSELDQHPTNAFAVWADVFSPSELELIQTAPRDRGSLIASPSHVLHRVKPCPRGTRKAIVAWTTGPQSK